MPRLEPTNKSYIREMIREELESVSPRFAIITDVHPHMTDGDTSNYKVDVRLTEANSEGEVVTHTHVPVTAAMAGGGRGLQSGDLALVQYRRADSSLPMVTDILYDDTATDESPLVDTGDFRLQIGNDATIEIVTNDDGDRMINIGKQTTDRDGIDAGLSINIDDGSFSLMNENEHGLFVDADGNSIQKWESYASPWGAAGDVNWEDSDLGGSGSGSDGTEDDSGSEQTYTATVTVQEADGSTVEGATVTIDLPDTETTEFEGTTSSAGSVSTELADGQYTVTATHPDTGEAVEDSLTVDGADVAIAVSFTE